MKYLILAAGKSKRFGRNKLEEKFGGVSLPQQAAKFALENGATEIYLTISRDGVRANAYDIYHPVLRDIKKICDPHIIFQPDDVYGPGAAISAWSGIIDGPFIVLFGDNFYKGKIPQEYMDRFIEPTNQITYFTTLTKIFDPRNLQLSAVINGCVIEKPHGYTDGDFFCGFVRFPDGAFNNFSNLQRSDRGEMEITDMINMSPYRQDLNLLELGIKWDDLTYEADIERIQRLMGDEG